MRRAGAATDEPGAEGTTQLPGRAWSRDKRLGLLLVLATLLAYHPAWQGKPVWDDDIHLTQPGLTSLSGLARIWLQAGATHQYYPAVHSVFWLEYHIWGYSTLGYHLVNILLHSASALLLVRVLRRLRVPGAMLAGGIFALHPVQVESVAWISELKNTLSGFFYLSAALTYLKFEQERDGERVGDSDGRSRAPSAGNGANESHPVSSCAGESGGPGFGSRSQRWYALSLGLFVLGLLSKTVIATLPAGLLVVFWWQRGRVGWKREIWPLVPFFVVGAAAGLFTAWIEYQQVGAGGADFAFTAVERCLIAGRALWFYLGKLCWPANLIFIYPRWHLSREIWWQYLFPLASLALVVALWKLARHNRGPLAALLFFAGTLFPALGFLNVYPFRFSFVADHFQYQASLGIIVLAAAGTARLLGRWGLWRRAEGDALCLTLLALLAVLTWRHSAMFADLETLWGTTLARNSGSFIAQDNYGNVLLAKGQVEEANAHFRRAVEIEPRDAEGYVNLGYVLLKKEQFPEAMAQFKKALSVQPYNPAAHSNLALLLLRQGQPDEAVAHFEQALLVQPDNATLLNNLAWVRATSTQPRLRNGAEAVRLAERACQLTGWGQPHLLMTLAVAYAEAGRFDQALSSVHRACEIASALGLKDLAEQGREMAQLFVARRPYREP